MNNEVKLSKTEYDKMMRKISKLDALEDAGVYDWVWYDDALQEWRKQNERDELVYDFIESINNLLVEAEVDYPAGRDAGHSITFDEEFMKKLLVDFIVNWNNAGEEG